MIGYIYITTNLINGKKYIGRHESKEFDTKYKGSGTVLLKAFDRYGNDNFECHILDKVNNVPTVCDTFEQLVASEEYYIDYYNCVPRKDYYNLKPGGLGGSNKGYITLTSPDGTKHKRMFPEDIDEYILNGWYIKGPIPSEETKLKRANSNRGKKRSKETCDRISKSLTGKSRASLSESHKKKLSDVGKNNQPTMKEIICIETGETFKSLGEASRALGICTSNICNNLKGKRLYAGKNLSFKYKE